MRLCSLIPAPGAPSRKYFGVLAAGAKARSQVVPKPTVRREKHKHGDSKTPALPVAGPVKWADLLKRVWGLDSLDCPRCHGRMTPMAIIQDRAEARRFLAHLGELTEHARARAPPDAEAA